MKKKPSKAKKLAAIKASNA